MLLKASKLSYIPRYICHSENVKFTDNRHRRKKIFILFLLRKRNRQSVTQNAHMVVREQLWGTGFFLLFGSQRLDSGHMAWQQVPLCTELSCWALMHRKHFFFNRAIIEYFPELEKEIPMQMNEAFRTPVKHNQKGRPSSCYN